MSIAGSDFGTDERLELTLRAPLGMAWPRQYVRLPVPDLEAGRPVRLLLDGEPIAHQFTGRVVDGAAEVMLCLGFDETNLTRRLSVEHNGETQTDLNEQVLSDEDGCTIGAKGWPVWLAGSSARAAGDVGGPFDGFAGIALPSTARHSRPIEARTLRRTADGPLYCEYRIDHAFTGGTSYAVRLRCFRDEPIVQVSEWFNPGIDAAWDMVLDADGPWSRFIDQAGHAFEQGAPPAVQPLETSRPDGMVCRLQMPPLGPHIGPINRGWFALAPEADDGRMLGLMGLWGDHWREPTTNMMNVLMRDDRLVLTAPVRSGARHWLMYVGPIETSGEPKRPFVFHRMWGAWNDVPLEQHLDLDIDIDINLDRDSDGEARTDDAAPSVEQGAPGVLGERFRDQAREAVRNLPPLQRAWARRLEAQPAAGRPLTWSRLTLEALVEPSSDVHRQLHERLLDQFSKWLREFQGERDGERDYARSIIGFSRRLREMMIDYELLCRDMALNDARRRAIEAWLIFAGRRIADEGRWPHSRSWLHPDHPESMRDLYTYPGEHKPDRLVWTNSLPNFQSDPLCALLHLTCMLPETPETRRWHRLAIEDLERQLDAYCSPSGAWEESINYTLFTLSYFIPTFRILKRRRGIDYFQDERVRRLLRWLVRFFGPYDKRFDAWTWPAVGNSMLPQNEADRLLAFAAELPADDALRRELIAVYQCCEDKLELQDHVIPVVATAGLIPEARQTLSPVGSEHMVDLGVAMRHDHPSPTQSYLFQKIGLFKDHYENDETSFNWYAKGTPLVMDYGTYTGEAAVAGAHNLVEVPDADSLRRGYLAQKLLNPLIDYTHCEVPVLLKLAYGRMRSFDEVDDPDMKSTHFYLDPGVPIGPKVWKTRRLLYVRPDYVVLLDRVVGPTPHRFNLHVVADEVDRRDNVIEAPGRFDLDLLCYVQHPQRFSFATGTLSPPLRKGPAVEPSPHRQAYFRVYNEEDDLYRTLLFARERDRAVTVTAHGSVGMRVETPEYCDFVFLHDSVVEQVTPEACFTGRAGWIRRHQSGRVSACMVDGELIHAFGYRVTGRGPWWCENLGAEVPVFEGPPRSIEVMRE